MPDPQQPLYTLDDQIEKRLDLLSNGIQLKMMKEVDSTIKDRFDTTGKILGWAFGLVALLFGGLGIKTLIDVRDIARTTAVDEVKKTLELDNPNSAFRRDVDRVVAGAVINSYLLTISKQKQANGLISIDLTDSDLRRLIELITDPKTDDKEFSDALEILTNSSQINSSPPLSRTIRLIATSQDK